MKTNGTSQYDTLLDTFRLGDPTATGLIPQVGLILSDSGSVPFEKIGKIWICGERLEKNIENSWKLRQEICDLSMGFQDLCRNFIVEYIYISIQRGIQKTIVRKFTRHKLCPNLGFFTICD